MSLRIVVRSLLFCACLSLQSSAEVYVNFHNVGITWSNTQLGGGVPQPVGYIILPDVKDGFTGTLGIDEFLSWSDVKYGSFFEFTWNEKSLLGSSTISFVDGKLSDVNLAYLRDNTLLVLSGPPTANWAIINSPQPPAVDFPGFPTFNGGFARGDLAVSLDSKPISLDQKPDVPPIADPVPQDTGVARIRGFIDVNTEAGADAPDTKLWREFRRIRGKFSMLAGFEQTITKKPIVNQQLYFAHVVVNGKAVVAGQPINIDSDYHLLTGEPYAFSNVHDYAAAVVSEVCDTIKKNRLGVCIKIVGKNRVFIGLGIYKDLPPDGIAILIDALSQLDGFSELGEILGGQTPLQFSAEFDGGTAHKSLPIPILEAPLSQEVAVAAAVAADGESPPSPAETPDVRVQVRDDVVVDRDEAAQ